jgi:hypothetical protein
MWAHYEFKTTKKNNELREIIKQYNDVIGNKQHPSWKINLRQTFSELVTDIKSSIDELLSREILSREDFPDEVLKLYDSIDAGKAKRYVKFYPDVYDKVLAEMSGPAARLYLALKLFVRHQGKDVDTTFVSRKTLAETLDVSIKWVEKYIAELKKLGLVKNLAPKGSRRNLWKVE